MRVYRLILGFAFTTLVSCSHHATAPGTSSATVDGVTPRARPPIVASHCAGLSAEERREASEYVSKVSRVEPNYRPDPRLILDHSSALSGVSVYIPAERGINRAYLERLLSCHAIQPAQLNDHPNDPLLAPGITSVDVVDADGGQYRISISFERRRDGEHILQRARALGQTSGSIQVQQLHTATTPQ